MQTAYKIPVFNVMEYCMSAQSAVCFTVGQTVCKGVKLYL